jgi:hypothetical protein
MQPRLHTYTAVKIRIMLRPTVSLSRCQAPILGLRPDFYYCQTVVGSLMWGAVSDEGTGLPFTVAPLPIAGQEFSFAGMRLPSCFLATDIYITVSS